MLMLKELFERDNVPLPEWLSYEHLEDDWKNSVYSFEGNKHIWSLKTPFKNVCITYDGMEYKFYGIIDEEVICLEIITEDHVIQF